MAAREHFHPEGLRCPRCGSGEARRRFFGQTQTSRLTVYRCLQCEGIYNLYSGILFEKKHLRPSRLISADVVLADGSFVDPDPANKEIITAWARKYWKALHPHSAGGAYMMMEEGQDRVKASYRENYERLAAIKHKYDPANLFRMNQNVKPGG